LEPDELFPYLLRRASTAGEVLYGFHAKPNGAISDGNPYLLEVEGTLAEQTPWPTHRSIPEVTQSQRGLRESRII